jgi:hypothetical protein
MMVGVELRVRIDEALFFVRAQDIGEISIWLCKTSGILIS